MTARRSAIAIGSAAAIASLVVVTRWLRLPRAAVPSPLLEALAITPPALTGPRCHRDYPGRATAWRTGLALLTGEVATTCVLPLRPASLTAGARRSDLAHVSADRQGRAYSASRTRSGLGLAAAAALADSVLQHGRQLRGARAIVCGGPPAAAGPAHQAQEAVQGWETSDYTALVYVHHSVPATTHGYSVNIEASRGSFVVCMGGRKRSAGS
jgi:hypothetical protein